MANITCTVLEHEMLMCNGTKFEKHEHAFVAGSPQFWIYLSVYIFLMLFAGIMSGLTLGLLSLDQTQLEILRTAGRPKEKKYAKRIWPLVKRRHLLLVTLLLANAGAVEAMPIFMDRITNPVIAILVSVTAVLIFGEVIPQALCSRYGLAIGYYLSPLVYLIIGAFYIVAWPISKFLDCLLGDNHVMYFRRSELKVLVDVHSRVEEHNEEPLSLDEALIIQGALDLKHKVARDSMIPLKLVFMLDVKAKLDNKTMDLIIEGGHSRIPIYEGSRENIVGIILVKTVIKLDPADCVSVKTQMRTKNLITFMEDEPLYNILNAFQTGRSHICIVKKMTDQNKEVTTGIITLEDVMEEILQEEIVDETDQYEDIVNRIKVARSKRRISKSITSSLPSQTQPLLQSTNSSGKNLAIDEKTPLLKV